MFLIYVLWMILIITQSLELIYVLRNVSHVLLDPKDARKQLEQKPMKKCIFKKRT